MDRIRFRCCACKEFVEMNRNIPDGFADWAYNNVGWSDFDETFPELSDQYWNRSDRTPQAGELRTVKVTQPFDEEINSQFNIIFEPAAIALNGWEDYPDQIDKCAVVRCRFEKVLIIDDYSAWIKVRVISSTLVTELFKVYPALYTACNLYKFGGITECTDEYLRNERWIEKSWDGQGDIGETKYIYIDDDGISHLVIMEFYSFHDSILYLGNVIKKS